MDNLNQDSLILDKGINLDLGLLVLITRISIVNKYLYEWDSVQYTLGLENFDLLHHQPHPPGCIIYLALVKVANIIAHDPQRGHDLHKCDLRRFDGGDPLSSCHEAVWKSCRALAGVLLFAFIPVFLVLWSGGSDIYGGGLSRDIPSISSLSICHLRKQIAHKGTYRPCAIDQHLYHRIDLPSSSRDEIHQLFEFSFLIITALLHYRVSTFNL